MEAGLPPSYNKHVFHVLEAFARDRELLRELERAVVSYEAENRELRAALDDREMELAELLEVSTPASPSNASIHESLSSTNSNKLNLKPPTAVRGVEMKPFCGRGVLGKDALGTSLRARPIPM